jgi:hypothetical protein
LAWNLQSFTKDAVEGLVPFRNVLGGPFFELHNFPNVTPAAGVGWTEVAQPTQRLT